MDQTPYATLYVAPSYTWVDRVRDWLLLGLVLAVLALVIACLVFIKRERDAIVDGKKAMEAMYTALLHLQSMLAPPVRK